MFSNPDHIIIYLILSSIFIIWGYYIRTFNNKSYYITSILPITIYSLVEGFRYGRGNDYFAYKTAFENPYNAYKPEEPIFKWLNILMNELGFNYVGAYIVYSLIFCICAVILLKEYKKYAFGIYAFFIPATFMFSEYAIRQAVSFSFIFLAIKYFYDRKWLYVGLSILCATGIHNSSIISLIIIGALYLIKKPLSLFITVPLYLFFTYLFDTTSIDIIMNYASNLNFSSYQHYIDSSEQWLSGEAISDIYNQSFFTKTIRTIFDISIIIIGYLALKLRPNQKVLLIYTTFIFGSIFFRAFFNIEILRRIAEPIYLFWFIVVGYSFYILYEYKAKTYWIYFLKYAIILYVLAFFGRFIFLNPEARFVWNLDLP